MNERLHVTAVQLRRKSLQVVSCTKSRVELGRISDPIAVVRVAIRRPRSLIVLINGTNPNYIERDIKDCGPI